MHYFRYSIRRQKPYKCYSGQFDEDICTFGMGDLTLMATLPHLFVNKMSASKDYSAIACWAQYLADRTQTQPGLELSLYKRNPVVRFNKDREVWKKNVSLFRCWIWYY